MREIITVLHPNSDVLLSKTEAISPNEFSSIQEIARDLYEALKPYFPAAGLAAPQIGIVKSVFLFSYDRDPAHLEAVVNPTFTPIGDEMTVGWEGCLSVINACYKIAKVPRHTVIKAIYYSADGKKVEKTLDGFASKVFQHECDHLQGVLNINRPDAEVKEFETKEAMDDFLREVKKQDALRYTPTPQQSSKTG